MTSECGELIYPNCGFEKMGKYEFWTYRKYYDKTQWLFYNKITKKRKWKCWSIFGLCGYNLKCGNSPCDRCFEINNDNIENPENKNIDCGCDRCCPCSLCTWLLYYFLYAFYLIFFFWFDIIYYCCIEEKSYQIFTVNGEKNILIKNGIWKNFGTEDYTKEFYEEFYPNLFYCERCKMNFNTFRDFIRKGGSMVLVNVNQDTGPQLLYNNNSN